MVQRSVTQKEIAERLGVSIATVSRVLNDRPGVSPEIRARVLQAVQEMGYAPNASARTLSTARTQTIGYITYVYPIALPPALVPGSVSSGFVQGIDEELSRRGYHMLTSHVDQEAMGRLHVPDMVQQRRVDGLILVGPALSSRYVLALRRAGLPIVLIDNLLGETPIDCILWDNENGAYQGTRHLIVGHGHRHIAFLSGPAEWFSSRERAVGYRRALQEAGLDPHIVHMPSTTFATGRQAMRTALEERPALTAVMAVNDAMAAGAIHACQEAGRAVPADVAVVGFDDAPWAEMVTPPLTTLHVPEREVGVQAARRMVDLIERGGQVPVQMRLSVELVVRQSCGCHPA